MSLPKLNNSHNLYILEEAMKLESINKVMELMKYFQDHLKSAKHDAKNMKLKKKKIDWSCWAKKNKTKNELCQQVNHNQDPVVSNVGTLKSVS